MAPAVDDAAERLRAGGVPVDALDLPEGWDRLAAAARTINDYEGARTHAARYGEFGERIGRAAGRAGAAGPGDARGRIHRCAGARRP